MDKNRWVKWRRRIPERLNSVSGVATVGGTAISVAGGAFLTGVAATVLGVGGIVIAASAFGYAVYSAYPRSFANPADIVGHSIELSQLDNVYPPIPKLAVVGPTRSGKTTLKQRLQFQPPPDERTQKVTATIVSIPSSPVSFMALLDGGGEKYPQQFKIAEYADYLCLVVDHNQSEIEAAISEERKKDTSLFMVQIREHLNEIQCNKKKWIVVVANKHDLWGSLPNGEAAAFNDFVEVETKKWKEGNYSNDVRCEVHSNRVIDDVSRFMDILAKSVQTQ